MTAPGGTFVEIGNINVGWSGSFDPSTAVMRSVTLIGVAHYRARDLAGALAFVDRESDRLPLDQMLASRFDLTDINDAFVQQDAGRVTRSALVPHPPGGCIEQEIEFGERSASTRRPLAAP